MTALILAGALGVWHGIPLLAPAIGRLTGTGPAVPITDRASIAVLPFANQSAPEEDYFSDGLTEDLISALGRFSSLSVMSWNAVASYRDQAVRPEQLAQDLGVRYVVDGSVRRAGDRLRAPRASRMQRAATCSGPSVTTRRSTMSSPCTTISRAASSGRWQSK